MNPISAQDEQAIFEHYKKGTHRIIITRLYKITSARFKMIVRRGKEKEENKKNKPVN